MTTIVHLELQLDAGRLEEAATVIRETLEATRAWPGNEGLEVIVDDADPARVVVVEQWASTADHDAYAAWRLTPEGAHQLAEIVVARPVKTIYSRRIPLDS
ncbi:antibiotic biosynthesis monooxygenase [Rhodococcus antarcticus]|jgi:quinol monooxygenase YgiN|uniref:Antibiotic biosynthesis monooxygenase n=1 Tax=Rhodococcus antarcticus TaxID=2987751 RepID=A0ABY6P3K4_9NOCA|nr:antibiotic biosynthesis monooxygenase [Rhodococcus antarcticus]UZJ26244.1 antibiotic biosynthesis monooxygenase [Rhodococcus antarcticus]